MADDTTPPWIHSLLPADGGKVSVTVASNNPTTNPTTALAAQAVAPKAAAPAPPALKQWFNPYTGKTEGISGMNAAGVITDPNAFWNYYAHYKSATLNTIAQNAAKAGNVAYGRTINYDP